MTPPLHPPHKAPIRRYYTPYEVELSPGVQCYCGPQLLGSSLQLRLSAALWLQVAQHNTPDDCWVSILGTVYDLTRLIKAHPGKITESIIKAAGTDISHWFDAKSKDVKKTMCPITQLERPYLPAGPIPHVPPLEPMGNWDTSFGIPWWKDKKYQIGSLSARTRVVRMKNVLTSQEDCLEVPSEEHVVEIRERYLDMNYHAASYTFKALVQAADGAVGFQELDMNKTLDDNGVVDETRMFEDLQIPTDEFIPVIHVYWNDDLTVA